MIRRLLITFVLVLVLGFLAFYGVSYFTKEEPLNEIPFSSPSHPDASKSSSSLPPESTSPATLEANKSTEVGRSTTAEKPSESSGSSTSATSRSVTPPRSTETTSSGVSGMSSEGTKETTKPSVERETPSTTGSGHVAESSKHSAESTPGTSSTSSFAKASESGKKEKTESGRKERAEESTSSGRKDRTQETTTGSRKRSETYVSEEESPSIYRKRTSSGSMTSSSREMLRLNVVAIGYFRTEEEARSVAPYIARNAGLSDYMVTKARDRDYYTIQVGAYVNKEEADRLVERLSQQRFPVRLESKVVPLSALNKNRVDYQRY
ncbi:MAG TPA: SPOR domain-containing protein [Candidatus Limnocylindrales bacterium]|nr:SPOR domain-containing protein [Candidatus Limnocylindrales bacterium]